jgi:hypothetical protein
MVLWLDENTERSSLTKGSSTQRVTNSALAMKGSVIVSRARK